MTASSKKRPRERSTADSELFAIYEDLASENEQVRFKAAISLIKRLQTADAEALVPILRRLIKGVCSSRKGARLGFSAALTEILNHNVGRAQTITVHDVLTLLQDLTQPPGDAAGQEARDYYIGRLFVAQALALSGAFDDDKNQDDDSWSEFIDVVFQLAKKKPWLREQCAWVLSRALPRKDPKTQSKDSQLLLKSLVDHGLAKTPEGVALWTRARLDFKPNSWPSGVFEQNEPLAPTNRSLLKKIMKDSSQVDEETSEVQAQRGSWSAAPNFAWNEIFSGILRSGFARDFATYWRELVDEGIFAAISSNERKQSGFVLLATTFTSLQTDLVPSLLTKNIIVNFNQQLLTKKGYLHQAANKALQAILERAQKDPVIIPGTVSHLLTEESISKLVLGPNLRTKLLEKLVLCADPDHAEEVVKAMLGPLRSSKTLQTLQHANLENLVVLFVARIRSLPYPSPTDSSLRSTRELYLDFLTFLINCAYFGASAAKEKQHDGAAVSQSHDKEFFRAQLNSALANLLTKDLDHSYYYVQAVKSLAKLQKAHQDKPVLDKQVQTEVDKAIQSVMKLSKQADEQDPHRKALSLLFSLCIIQVYSGDADALEVLDELQECFKSLSADNADEEQSEAVNAMVEVLLTFISKPASMFKIVAQKAFSSCADIVTSEGLRSMIEVLKSKENISGQIEMFDERGDEDDEGEEGQSDDDIEGMDDSDVEMVDAGENNGQDNTSDDSDSEDDENESSDDESAAGSDSSSIDDEDADDAELIAFDAKLAEALGTRRADDDVAHDEEESSESDMDDEQMEALDEHITNVFKQRKQADGKNKKKEAKEARENMVVFKTRVLELLKIYIIKEHANPLTLQLVSPLVYLVKDTHNAKVRGEALELLNNYFKRMKLVKKDANVDKSTRKEAKRLLVEVHGLVGAKRSKPLQSACSRASLLLTKTFLSNGGDVEVIKKQYEKTSQRVADKQVRYKDEFFKGWEDWYQSAKKDLDKAGKANGS